MVTKIIEIGGNKIAIEQDGTLRKVSEYYGKSGDEKPANGAKNADIFYEMDTKKVFMFDEDGSAWLEQ